MGKRVKGKTKTWVLVDNRAGNSNQGKALANLLNLDYTIKNLEYNLISTLPNFIKYGFLELTKKSKEDLFNSKDTPDFIISSGRRMASIAVALKNKYPKCKILQIMHPGLSLKHFEVLILPEHDKKPQSKYINKTIFITGALSYYSSEQAAADKKKWNSSLGPNKYKGPIITVLIGGKSKGCDLTVEFVTKLLEKLDVISKKLKASLFISTSRRTPPDVINYLRTNIGQSIKRPYLFFDPSENKMENPYRGFLAFADYIVVTGDSISMCSEAAHTMKPTYIFYNDALITEKHLRFINTMFSNNYARPFTDDLEEYRPNSQSSLESLKKSIMNSMNL